MPASSGTYLPVFDDLWTTGNWTAEMERPSTMNNNTNAQPIRPRKPHLASRLAPIAIGLVLSLFAMTSCGSAQASSVATTPAPQGFAVEFDGPVGRAGETSPEAGEVKLWVSNQSLSDPEAPITVSIDGQPVVAEEFANEDGHNTIGYIVRGLTPDREHTISVAGPVDPNTELPGTFTLHPDAATWISVAYWHNVDYPNEPNFTLEVANEPFGFD